MPALDVAVGVLEREGEDGVGPLEHVFFGFGGLEGGGDEVEGGGGGEGGWEGGLVGGR